jgi:hypothetical protein
MSKPIVVVVAACSIPVSACHQLCRPRVAAQLDPLLLLQVRKLVRKPQPLNVIQPLQRLPE